VPPKNNNYNDSNNRIHNSNNNDDNSSNNSSNNHHNHHNDIHNNHSNHNTKNNHNTHNKAWVANSMLATTDRGPIASRGVYIMYRGGGGLEGGFVSIMYCSGQFISLQLYNIFTKLLWFKYHNVL
jgi:hypothetical protein